MNYLSAAIKNHTNEHSVLFAGTKKCNAITCIHNCNGFCLTFKDLKCDFYEQMLIQEQ